MPQQVISQKDKLNVWALLGFIFAFVAPILGLIFSIIALVQIKKTGERGRGFAIAGLIIAIVFFVIIIILAVIGVLKQPAFSAIGIRGMEESPIPPL
jgi:uncharacterized membrane protein